MKFFISVFKAKLAEEKKNKLLPIRRKKSKEFVKDEFDIIKK